MICPGITAGDSRGRPAACGFSSTCLLFLLKLSVFGFGFFQDGSLRISVFPEREKALIGGNRPGAGFIGICFLRGSSSRALARAAPRCANAPVQQFQIRPP